MAVEGSEAGDAVNPAPEAEQSAAPVVQVRAAVARKINLADFQNSVPALLELAVVNETAQEIRHLTLSVSAEPAFVKPKSWTLDAVGSGQTFHVTQLDLQLDGAHLSRLTEAEPATVVFELRSHQPPVEPIASCEQRIELLARNQWGGISDNRSVEEVCEAELTSLARGVLSRGCGGQDALISMARELGLQRLREASRGRLEDALRRAQAA